MAALQGFAPPEIYNNFLEMRDKLTFLDGPRTFVGIRRISLEKINGQMKRFLSQPTTIPEMAKIVSKLCTLLTNRSSKSFQSTRENFA